MKRTLAPRPAVAGLLALGSVVALPAASPFDADLGQGRVAQMEVTDDQLSLRAGRPVAYAVRYTRWQPTRPNDTVIIYNHGLQSHRGWFNATADELAARGYTVYAFDRIGSGESSDGRSWGGGRVREARGHIRDWELFVEVLDRMVLRAAEQNPGAQLVLWGNSYGAKVVTAYLFSRAAQVEARAIARAVFTTPGLYANERTMPLPFSRCQLIFSGALERFPVPMVEHDGDNGASWFVGPGPWFDKIRDDDLSLREATRMFWMETRDMDRYIASRSNSATISVPAFYLLVRDDQLMDNQKVERHVAKHAPHGLLKYYPGGPQGKHFLPFTEDAEEALNDIGRFLDGRPEDIPGAEAP